MIDSSCHIGVSSQGEVDKCFTGSERKASFHQSRLVYRLSEVESDRTSKGQVRVKLPNHPSESNSIGAS